MTRPSVHSKSSAEKMRYESPLKHFMEENKEIKLKICLRAHMDHRNARVKSKPAIVLRCSCLAQ